MRTGKWGEGDGRQFLKVGTGSLLPTWGQNLQQDSHHPNQPALAAFVPLPFRNVVWAGAVLIIHITVGTFGTHKAVQSYSKFPVPATAFCIVIQDGACPRGWRRTRTRTDLLRSPSLLSSQSHSDSKSDVHYFILQKSRSWPLIHKNAASPCSVSEATFLRHLALQTGGSLVSYTQGRLYEKFICCTC